MSSIAQSSFYSKALTFAFCIMISALGSVQASAVNTSLNIEITDTHGDFDIDKIKSEIKGLLGEYGKAVERQDQKQVVLNIENTLLKQIKAYPTHEKEILQAARTMIKDGDFNWIILRNERQLKINVIADQPATSKGQQ